MKKSMVFRFLLIIQVLFCTCLFGQKQVSFFGKNLLKNPGAETPKTTTGINGWKPLQDTGNFTFLCASYGEIKGEWAKNCDESCGIPADAGKRYFRFPTDAAHRELGLFQDIDLKPIIDSLKSRNVSCDLMAFIAGLPCSKHGCATGSVNMIYYSADGKEIKHQESERDNAELMGVQGNPEAMRQYDLILVHNQVPVNATRIRIVMKAKAGSCCTKPYIFFDNLSLTLVNEGPRAVKK